VGRQQAGGLAPVGHAEAAKDDADAVVDGVGGDVQRAGDFLGPHAAQDQAQNFAIPRREQRDGVRALIPTIPHGGN
jgi:hypothetical protein